MYIASNCVIDAWELSAMFRRLQLEWNQEARVHGDACPSEKESFRSWNPL